MKILAIFVSKHLVYTFVQLYICIVTRVPDTISYNGQDNSSLIKQNLANDKNMQHVRNESKPNVHFYLK